MHKESHNTDNINWLRAAVLGANDGIVSVGSLAVGVAASGVDHQSVIIATLAGTVAGAMSMAAGEYVSVSSQADSEHAIIAKEKQELADMPEEELEELTRIYEKRGLPRPLAEKTAQALTEKDALTAHLRDELGITEELAANPLQAAVASALSFLVGAGLPLVAVILTPNQYVIYVLLVVSLLSLVLLGWFSAWIGGAPILKPTTRIALWGTLAMVLTIVVGYYFSVGA